MAWCPASPPVVSELPVDCLVGGSAAEGFVTLHEIDHTPLDEAVAAAHGPGPELEEGLVLMLVLKKGLYGFDKSRKKETKCDICTSVLH